MGKASQRKKAARPGADEDVHKKISAEAEAMRNMPRLALQPAERTPALSGLLDSAAGALADAVPASFEHLGRTYYLRVSLAMVRVMVFETATSPMPMTYGITGSDDEYGHLPYH